MRINLAPDDIPQKITPTRSIPVESIGQIICEFKASVEQLKSLVEDLIVEVKGLRIDINKGIKKADEGVEVAGDVLSALKEL